MPWEGCDFDVAVATPSNVNSKYGTRRALFCPSDTERPVSGNVRESMTCDATTRLTLIAESEASIVLLKINESPFVRLPSAFIYGRNFCGNRFLE